MKRNLILLATLACLITTPALSLAETVEVEEEVIAETEYTTQNPSATSYGSSSYGGSSTAVGNYALKVGPIGNFYIADSRTELDPGIGGYIGFDYRFHQHFSAEVALMATI
jgi:hypothetical protein